VALAPRQKLRDAERSRAAILAAAERLFARRGFDGTSLSDIGAEAGLSRGAPSYFFGSKEQLYADVLAAAFASRQLATERAFEPVRAWAAGAERTPALRSALMRAATGYLTYLSEHPTFVALIMREELADAGRLRGASSASTAMQDAFLALRRAGARRGLRKFRVDEAVLLFVSLTFAPVSYRHTLLRGVGVEASSASGIRRQARLAVEQMMHFLCR